MVLAPRISSVQSKYERSRDPTPMGVPQDADGFIPVYPHGLVHGLADVYAVGDVTASSIKLADAISVDVELVSAADCAIARVASWQANQEDLCTAR